MTCRMAKLQQMIWNENLRFYLACDQRKPDIGIEGIWLFQCKINLYFTHEHQKWYFHSWLPWVKIPLLVFMSHVWKYHFWCSWATSENTTFGVHEPKVKIPLLVFMNHKWKYHFWCSWATSENTTFGAHEPQVKIPLLVFMSEIRIDLTLKKSRAKIPLLVFISEIQINLTLKKPQVKIPLLMFMSEIQINITLKKSNFLFLLCFKIALK